MKHECSKYNGQIEPVGTPAHGFTYKGFAQDSHGFSYDWKCECGQNWRMDELIFPDVLWTKEPPCTP